MFILEIKMGWHTFSKSKPIMILWQTRCWQISRILLNAPWPLAVTVTNIGTFLQSQHHTVELLPEQEQGAAVDFTGYSESNLVIAAYRYFVIESLLAEEPTDTVIRKRIDEIRQILGDTCGSSLDTAISMNSIKRWQISYKKFGLFALTPNTMRRGGVGQSRLDPVVEQLLSEIQQQSPQLTHRAYREILAAKISVVNSERSSDQQLLLPSLGTIRNRLSTSGDKSDLKCQVHCAQTLIDERQVPTIAFAPQSQSIGSLAQLMPEVCSAVGLPFIGTTAGKFDSHPTQCWYRSDEVVEIDHGWLPSIYLLSDHGEPLGMAHLTVGIFRESRFPAGFYAGINVHDHHTVASCLQHICSRKSGCPERYGTKFDFLSYGPPAVLVADNAEEFKRAYWHATTSLGIITIAAPVRAPWFKGRIERFIKTVKSDLPQIKANDSLREHLMALLSDSQREVFLAKNQELTVLTESSFQQLLHQYLLDYYGQRRQRSGRIPWQARQDVIRRDFAQPVEFSSSQLTALLGYSFRRLIRRDGVEFEGLTYGSRELDHLRDQMEGKVDRIVECRINVNNIDRIYVMTDRNACRFAEVPIAPCRAEYARGLSLATHRIVRKLARKSGDVEDPAHLGRTLMKLAQTVNDSEVQVSRTQNLTGRVLAELAHLEEPVTDSSADTDFLPKIVDQVRDDEDMSTGSWQSELWS